MKITRRQLRSLIKEVFRDSRTERNLRRAQAGIDAATARNIKQIEDFDSVQGIELAQSLGSEEPNPAARYDMSKGVPLQLYKNFIDYELKLNVGRDGTYEPIAHKTLESTLREMWPQFAETKHHPFEEVKFFAALGQLIKAKVIDKVKGSGKITYNDDGTYDIDREGTYYASNH
jgi:hypothetical protein